MQINTGKIVKKLVNKTITSAKAEKNSSPEQIVNTPTLLPLNPKLNGPSVNRINWATIITFTGAVVSYNFSTISSFRYFAISSFLVLNTPFPTFC